MPPSQYIDLSYLQSVPVGSLDLMIESPAAQWLVQWQNCKNLKTKALFLHLFKSCCCCWIKRSFYFLSDEFNIIQCELLGSKKEKRSPQSDKNIKRTQLSVGANSSISFQKKQSATFVVQICKSEYFCSCCELSPVFLSSGVSCLNFAKQTSFASHAEKNAESSLFFVSCLCLFCCNVDIIRWLILKRIMCCNTVLVLLCGWADKWWTITVVICMHSFTWLHHSPRQSRSHKQYQTQGLDYRQMLTSILSPQLLSLLLFTYGSPCYTLELLIIHKCSAQTLFQVNYTSNNLY